MQKINYPLIVSDFDGTLVNADGTITKENKDAIERYLAAGGVFAISTGRLPAGILPRAKELGLSGILCCCQGAIILDIQTQEVLSCGAMPQTSAVAACKKMETLGLHIHAYDMWKYYSNADDGALRLYERATGTKATVIDIPMSEFLEKNGLCPYKLLAMVEPKRCDEVRALLQAQGFEGCEVTKSANYLVEITQKKYSKGTAVEFLANRYGIPLERTIAIGDQLNDTPMIEKAGLGIAVANADEGLKSRAKLVHNLTNEQSAVAAIIQEYGFYEEKEE